MGIRIYGNRQIATLPGEQTRPTAARVREALFNIWQGTIQDCRWLDICAGSGAMGAEALCRGAIAAVAIEQNLRACQIIEQNWQKVRQPHQTIQVLRGDVQRVLGRLIGQQFDRIYFDPPYASELYQPVLNLVAQSQLLAPSGMMAIEHSRDRQAWILPSNLELIKQKNYGYTSVSFIAQVKT